MKKKRVFVIGVRGFPNIQGGIETHCENLYPHIVNDQIDVVVLARKAYVSSRQSYKGVKLIPIWSPVTPGLEALVHSFLAVVYSIVCRPDILHIHAIGPSIFAPLARLFGLRVVCTHHGFDYEREKWGVVASLILRLGELMAAKFSSRFIAVSELACSRLSKDYNRDVIAISNGVDIHESEESSDILDHLGISPQKYFLSVSRIVKEKRQLDLINAFKSIENSEFKLVLVGGDGGDAEYWARVVEATDNQDNILLAGLQTGKDLRTLYRNTRAFVHASSLEGNPIVLLEAMSYGLPIIASDIPPNVEIGLDQSEYFKVGCIEELAGKMAGLISCDMVFDLEKINIIRSRYSWGSKAKDTLMVYSNLW